MEAHRFCAAYLIAKKDYRAYLRTSNEGALAILKSCILQHHVTNEIGTRSELELLGPWGQWFPAPPNPESFLFNAGDPMKRGTDGRFMSTPHRVINRPGRDRCSIPLFSYPNSEFVVECLPT